MLVSWVSEPFLFEQIYSHTPDYLTCNQSINHHFFYFLLLYYYRTRRYRYLADFRFELFTGNIHFKNHMSTKKKEVFCLFTKYSVYLSVGRVRMSTATQTIIIIKSTTNNINRNWIWWLKTLHWREYIERNCHLQSSLTLTKTENRTTYGCPFSFFWPKSKEAPPHLNKWSNMVIILWCIIHSYFENS